MKTLSALVLLCTLLTVSPQARQADYAKLKAEAERLYAEKSYAAARDLYAQADALPLPPAEARWVDFRLADTLWRAQAGTQTADATKYEQAKRGLEDLIRAVERAADRDRVWAEAHESLGDFSWTRRDGRDWGAAWPHYQQALDWWAGGRDLDLARERYLRIVWNVSQPPAVDEYYYYGYYGNVLPVEIVENALKVAARDEDRARAHFLLAMTLRAQGDVQRWQRLPEEFEAALQTGKATDWYDDALYFYAESLMSQGRVRVLDDGELQPEPDFVKALELLRRLRAEFRKGETRYYDMAGEQIKNITERVVSVSVPHVFLPGSEIQFALAWRNVRRVDFALYRVDLTRDVRFVGGEVDSGSWVRVVRTEGRERVRSWSKETGDKGVHEPGQESVRLDGQLPAGAYLLEARADGASAREVVLVTDASLVLKNAGRRALVYFCDALTGAPVANARVNLWERHYLKDKWAWRESAQQTNRDGVAVFDLAGSQSHEELFATADAAGRQAFAASYNYNYRQNEGTRWRVYAFPDRPAYRPGETAQWKFIARLLAPGGAYTTPSAQLVEYQINDPKGAKVSEGKATLNAFGSAWGSVGLTEAMPLGEYRVTFWDAERRHEIGSATLFRLEEYKLPEFKVTIKTPEEGGRKRSFRLGEQVEVKIQADYYYGGAVASGTAEVVVYQRPFYHYWQPPREYPWFYEDLSPARAYYGGGRGQQIKRETLKLDAAGQATLKFDTPRGAQNDFEYEVEARVTDASRREITAADAVRVTRQRYYVYPRAEHNIYRPQDKVTFDLKALDANGQPVVAEGRVTLTRDYWDEVWLSPEGKEVRGEELRQMRQRGAFPPTPARGQKPWRVKFVGYHHDEILAASVKTDDKGEAEFSFTPEREGYYRLAWSSPDRGAPPVKAEAVVWVASGATTETGFRPGGVQIIVDRDTFRAGARAPVMLTTPAPDRYVLFTVEGETLDSYQLVHLTGTAKLVELPIEERHVPNIFLSAAMVSDAQFFAETKQVVVPPVEHFLNVEVRADREQYQPREEGTLTVTTRDQGGRPVAAEVALGLVDESVFYIQRDYAGDPRQFYYGTKRGQYVQTQSTFQQKAYVKLVAGAQNQLVDARTLRDLSKDENDAPYSRLEMAADMARRPTAGVSESVEVVSENRAFKRIQVDGFGEFAMKSAPVNGRRDTSNLLMLEPPPPPGAAAQGQEPAVQVRSDFRSTILWQPDVVTDAAGTATLKVKYPDSLTGWTATARAASAANQFGIAGASTRTKQPLIVRLEAPRFFVVGDRVTVSAVINNNTDRGVRVAPSLVAEGLRVKGFAAGGGTREGDPPPVEVKANGEARVDWEVEVERAGGALLKVTARGDGAHADAMERAYAVHEHGIEKFVARSGKMRGEEVSVRLDLPRERRAESTSLVVQVAPSLAVTMLDALPYLIDYPYGCTEQTMSRFLPAAVTARTLKDLGLKPEAVMGKIFGGIEQATAAATHPDGQRDLRRLDEMTRQSLERLYNFQHADGGWGWWKEGESDHFMTAYVVWGMSLAREAGVKVKEDAHERGADYLKKEIVEEEADYDNQAWMLHALSSYHKMVGSAEPGEFERKAFDNLWANRDRLNAYTRSLLALSAHDYGFADRARVLVENLSNGVKRDASPDASVVERGAGASSAFVIPTAHWGEDGIYYRWSDGGVEATAFALRALVRIDPRNPLVEPVTNWLVKNRRGAQWSNTRDTAITVLALNDYLRVSGELRPSLEYELAVNGQTVVTKRLSAEDALSAPSRFPVSRELLRDGANEISIKRRGGAGPLYFSAEARFFSLEEPVTPAGNELFVRRDYFKLVPRRTLLKGYVYDRVPVGDGETVASGERVEVVLTVEAKNNYEYLLFEDLKPAGLEAVEVRSGGAVYARELKSGTVERKFGNGTAAAGSAQKRGAPPAASSSPATRRPAPSSPDDEAYTDRTRWVYQELRDRKVALFLDRLPEGVWEIRYDLRAEAPGRFHALPLLGHAMYVPEIRSNGTELRINVAEGR